MCLSRCDWLSDWLLLLLWQHLSRGCNLVRRTCPLLLWQHLSRGCNLVRRTCPHIRGDVHPPAHILLGWGELWSRSGSPMGGLRWNFHPGSLATHPSLQLGLVIQPVGRRVPVSRLRVVVDVEETTGCAVEPLFPASREALVHCERPLVPLSTLLDLQELFQLL